MQFNLFYNEDRLIEEYQDLIKSIKSSGKLCKFLDCRIRKYHIERSMDLSAILKALRDVETCGVDLCISISKKSSNRPLKTSDLNNVFTSVLSDSSLKLETSAEMCWNSFFEFKSSVVRIAIPLQRTLDSDRNSGYGGDSFQKYIDLVMTISTLGLLIRKEIEYDIQGR